MEALKKIKEEKAGKERVKTYLAPKRMDVLEVLSLLEANKHLGIIRITVDEDAQEYMKTFRETPYCPEDFREDYDHIRANGMGLQYDILCFLSGISLDLLMAEDNDRICLVCEDRRVEIDDVLYGNARFDREDL